ncbi:RNA-dependent RNA polymerase [Helicobasidium mompa dsRNA mycovirus]|uniref:RNA-dependent RNA polymerase n=1 Tax=Helicobasidium mompa dsRNA mycovirus TaxID=91913 RepID=Q8B0U3_9VIRU|nr:RNA-dependent RNA polymerase [Helicobasidium mompa dsRNA mycovirus]BAC23065.1 RNA-dependent RNA polymerase [Helicobasidium mompa dsRNA mycovirus]
MFVHTLISALTEPVQSTLSTTKAYVNRHIYEHNFQYQWTSVVSHTPARDEFQYQGYQDKVKEHLKRNLFGPDYDYIVNKFHHPVATNEDITNTFKKGDLPDHPVPRDEFYLAAVTETTRRFAPPQLIRPVHFADLRRYQWNWHPNVEEPYASNKELRSQVADAASAGLLDDARMSFGNLKNVVFHDVRTFLHRIKRNMVTSPSTLWPLINIHVKPALTHIDETKIRVVFGVSKRHVLPSAMFFWPLFFFYLKNRETSPLLWGNETILGGGLNLYMECIIPRLYFSTFVMVDWSSFDLRSLFSIIRQDIFPNWRTYFDFENGYIPTNKYRESKADPAHLEALWNWVCEACFQMPHRLPDGNVYKRLFRGIPSGLFTTQFLDSFYNMIMILTILGRMGFGISTVRIRVQGDDSLIRLIFHVPANMHAEFKRTFEVYAAYYFDSVARPEKTHITNNPNEINALGYDYPNGYPHRDWRKLLAQLLHPRSTAPRFSLLKARTCGIQYASMYTSHEVTNVCKDIYNDLDRQGIVAQDLPVQRDVILHSLSDFTIPTDHFPTMNEVTRYLRSPYQRTEADNEAYFPTKPSAALDPRAQFYFLSDH